MLPGARRGRLCAEGVSLPLHGLLWICDVMYNKLMASPRARTGGKRRYLLLCVSLCECGAVWASVPVALYPKMCYQLF